jgi:hypothetical protein
MTLASCFGNHEYAMDKTDFPIQGRVQTLPDQRSAEGDIQKVDHGKNEMTTARHIVSLLKSHIAPKAAQESRGPRGEAKKAD